MTKQIFFKRLIDVLFGIMVGFLLAADIVFARQIDFSKAGVSLWIFVAVGAFIILLQAIPAFILFTAFIGHFAKIAQDTIPVKKEETAKEQIEEVD